MNKPLKCPICGKRACDVSEIPKEKMYIETDENSDGTAQDH